MLLGHVISNTALRHPERDAIIFGEQHTRFSELDDRMNRIANGLRQIAEDGARIAVLSRNRPEVIELQHAVPMAGMGCVFVNYRLTPREVAYILQNSGAAVIAVSQEFENAIRGLRDQLPDLRTVITLDEPQAGTAGQAPDGAFGEDGILSYSQLATFEDDTPAGAGVDPNSLAWLVYTSGTTGRPKGAMLSHANIIAAVANSLGGAPSQPFGRYINPFPLCHIAAYGMPTQFADKSTVVLQEAFEAEDYMRTIQDLEITASSIAPVMLGLILSRPELDSYDVTSLRHISYGASSISPDLLRKSLKRFSNAEFFQAFGMTELAGNVAWMSHEWHLKGLEQPEILSAAGVTAPFAGIRIADPLDQPVANGEVGEIQVRADQAMIGYWQNEEATREAFAGEWYKTGDLGRMTDEGLLYVVDRKKDMILTGGLNVYSREVEDVLAEHPDIQDVAVIGVPEEIWGESVCAVIVRRPGSQLTAAEVTAFVKENLASFKKPKYVEFVDELPRNHTGKVLKRQLRQSYEHIAATAAETKGASL
ncbi:long-chain fatty acid--CoA ligase [Brevibacterium daeguense]|uniref:Long-chain fatty acid--CoA ligase n=1 Tax=Brevibacterium daeguense TaxID=909936 RepID=A0ABP8EFU1_9MICO|nr:AMP-binding protein [Brevibacterium daeguense]